METLLLHAVDVLNEDHWRWLLTDASGMPLADQHVALKPTSFEYQGFVDLLGYLTWNVTPDRRSASEAQLLSRLGDWLGSNLFGAVGQAIAARAPATVRVLLPGELEFLLHRPLALARVKGVPLAARTSLVFDMTRYTEDDRQRPKGSITGRLRMLAVFSLPTETSAGSLRREQYELSHLIRRIDTRFQAAVELRVLQYGVTRSRFEAVLEEGAGWDIIHLSGHGIAAGSGLILEQPDGSPDVLTADELALLLRRGRSQLKLVVISHNQSSAIGLAERRQYLGFGELPELEREDARLSRSPERGERLGRLSSGPPLSDLALKLATRLECAVLATRYPLAEEITLQFNDHFYSSLFERCENVVSAMSDALTATDNDDAAARLMAVASPILIGSRAVDLTLAPPRQEHPAPDDRAARLAHFPTEPVRFVGRNSPMAHASAALAPGSGYRGVLFHGLAGAGKTACALELTYRHADVFQPLLWWHAPTREGDAAAALASLGTALEMQLAGFSFRTMLGDTDSYQRQLIDLTTLLEELAVLVVLDGLDTLLTSTGQWRDPRWKELIDTLITQQGQSRIILTSRVPLDVDHRARILSLPIHTLSLDDTIMLAEELPNLRVLLHTSSGPLRARTTEVGVGIDRDRELVRRILHVVQGHPTLLEFADAAAADPERLGAQLAASDSTIAGQEREAFFRYGVSSLDAGQFTAVLAGWTMSALEVLTPPARLLAQFLACLEDDDRQSAVIEANWADLWRRLDRPGDPPESSPLLDVLTLATLIQPDTPPITADSIQPSKHMKSSSVAYRMHPGVAAGIQAATSPETRDAADTEMAAFWTTVAEQGERESGEDSSAIVRAGLAAAPYLLRLRAWDAASALLENVILRDASPGIIQAALPALRHIADATRMPKDYAVLASALTTVDPAEAEQLMRGALRDADGRGDYRLASIIAGDLAALLRDTGRLSGALDILAEKVDYSRQAELGPWTQIADQAQRLQILGLMGEHRQVLAETSELRTRMGQLPVRSADDETVHPWNVREAILDAAWSSALAQGEWQLCLDLNAENLASKRERGAGAHEIARTLFNDAGPLIRLRLLEEAGQLLRSCQQVFEDHADISTLAMVLSARADLEDQLGHRDAAVDLVRTALRLGYVRPTRGTSQFATITWLTTCARRALTWAPSERTGSPPHLSSSSLA